MPPPRVFSLACGAVAAALVHGAVRQLTAKPRRRAATGDSGGLTGMAVVQLAFHFLDGPADVLAASNACRRWRELACADAVWRVKYEREKLRAQEDEEKAKLDSRGERVLEPCEVALLRALLSQVYVGGNLAVAEFPWLTKYVQTYAECLSMKKLRVARRAYEILILGDLSSERDASRESRGVTIFALGWWWWWGTRATGSIGEELELRHVVRTACRVDPRFMEPEVVIF